MNRVENHGAYWVGIIPGTKPFFSFDMMTWYEPTGRPTGTDVQALFRRLAYESLKESNERSEDGK